MALGTNVLLNKINVECNNMWPGGLACKLIEKMKSQYQLKDRVSAVKMKRKMLKAPKEYAGILASTAKEQGGDLTMDDFEEAMQLQFYITYGDTVEPHGSGDELTLSVFDGNCYKCGKKGHKANKCPNKKGKQHKRFNGKCNNCGKEEHKEVDCWMKESNADKRPTWFNKNKEKGLATSGREEEESKCVT
eukprot:8282688-Ditylum_brightwellii.AAC.1